MVSIPNSERGLDINYPQSGPKPLRTRSIGSPTSPGSWEESLQQLSRELKVICRSPDGYDPTLSNFPYSPRGSPRLSPGPASPTSCESYGPDAKPLIVRHLQSEEKLHEKLKLICGPRSGGRSSLSPGSAKPPVSPEGTKHAQGPCKASRKLPRGPIAKTVAAKVARAAAYSKRKGSFGLAFFRATVDIGDRGIEDLRVIIKGGQLIVQSDVTSGSPRSSVASGSAPSPDRTLLSVVDIPSDVNPANLICIVRDGTLEVCEGKKKVAQKGIFVNGLDLKRSISWGARPHGNHTPIVIDDDGSNQLKLVLRIPSGYDFEDITIRTVDEHLIVSGKQKAEAMAVSSPTYDPLLPHHLGNGEFFHVFELPNSVDPYSITAHLTDSKKLIIHAKLTARKITRCNTL